MKRRTKRRLQRFWSEWGVTKEEAQWLACAVALMMSMCCVYSVLALILK